MVFNAVEWFLYI